MKAVVQSNLKYFVFHKDRRKGKYNGISQSYRRVDFIGRYFYFPHAVPMVHFPAYSLGDDKYFSPIFAKQNITAISPYANNSYSLLVYSSKDSLLECSSNTKF